MTQPTDSQFHELDSDSEGEPLEVDLLLSSDIPLEDLATSDDVVVVSHEQNEFIADEDEAAAATTPAKRGRPKAGEGIMDAPIDPNKPCTIYQRLVDYGLLKKVTDIVMAKVTIPWNLRDDATQEVHAYWSVLKANPKYARNQLARYAYMTGQHAALKLRRSIGAVVVIPGALFRTGRDTAFMESIGAAVNPKDVEEYKDSIELSTEPDEMLHLATVSEVMFARRLGGLQLTQKQLLVARKVLIEKCTAEQVAYEFDMQLVYVERLINQVANKLLAINKEAEERGLDPATADARSITAAPVKEVKTLKPARKSAARAVSPQEAPIVLKSETKVGLEVLIPRTKLVPGKPMLARRRSSRADRGATQ